MFHMGRCGSTVLGSLLDQHSRIRWDGEVFWRKWEQFGFELRAFDTRSFLREQMRVAGRRYYGFEMKIHPEQEFALAHYPLASHIEDLDSLGFTHFIVLERKNYLRRMLSQILGSITQRRFVGHAEMPALTRIHLDLDRISFGVVEKPRSLTETFSEIEKAYEAVRRLLGDRDVLELTYEDDLVGDPRIGYRRTCEFLQIPEEPVRVELRRTNPFPIRDIVANYEELEAALRGTRYEWMLRDDVENP